VLCAFAIGCATHKQISQLKTNGVHDCARVTAAPASEEQRAVFARLDRQRRVTVVVCWALGDPSIRSGLL
jgi:hypothetical protein